MLDVACPSPDETTSEPTSAANMSISHILVTSVSSHWRERLNSNGMFLPIQADGHSDVHTPSVTSLSPDEILPGTTSAACMSHSDRLMASTPPSCMLKAKLSRHIHFHTPLGCSALAPYDCHQ